MPSFEVATAVLGAVLILGALLSGLAQRSLLTLTALFTVTGFALGSGGLGWIDFKASSGFVTTLAEIALIVILFRDGMEVERELLTQAWRTPLRKLVLAMPITAGLVAVAARLLFGLSWTESLLLGALLSPTDPVLTSSIITNARVPRLVRHSLNLESGLNDGLALPAVLAFAAALSTDSHGFVWWRFVLQDIGLGFAFGIACGLAASVLMPGQPPQCPLPAREGAAPAGERENPTVSAMQFPSANPRGPTGAASSKGSASPTGAFSAGSARSADPLPSAEATPTEVSAPRSWTPFHHTIPDHQKSLYMLGVAFATYGVTVLSPHGNGFIAVFVAAIVLAVRRPELVPRFDQGAAEIVEVVKLGIFLTFGSLLTLHRLGVEDWSIAAFVAILFLVARPFAVWASLAGTATDTATRMFMGWFGPRGVATMTFSLLVLDRPIASGQRIFDIAAFVVLSSVVIHGATDTYGARWIARHAERAATAVTDT